MKPNAINYLSLAKKAGRIEIGEESTGAVARAQKARLVLLAADAPDNTRRRAKNFIAGTGQQLVTVPFTKEELGAALGKTVVSMAAMTDPALALAFLKALENDGLYAQAIADLTDRSRRVRQHRLEEKAHERNVRQGKKRHQPPASAPAAAHRSGAGKQPAAGTSGPKAPKKATGTRPAGRKTGRKSYGGAKS